MARRLILLVSVIAVSVALAGSACSGDDGETVGGDTSVPTAEEPVPGGTLRFGLASENTGFNPAADQVTLSGYQITRAVYDALVAMGDDDQWHPYLAESLTPNDDFTEWEIRLRPDVTFHDGTPLDSEVLKMNLDAQKDSPLLGQALNAVEQVDIVDDLTVNVVMDTPWSSFPHTLTAQPGIVVAPSVLQDPDGGQNPVGTGPFVFEEWIRDKQLTVTRNEDYWREGYPLLDRIEYRIIPDTAGRTAALRSGDVDIIEVRSGDQLAEFEDMGDDSGFAVYIDPTGETTEEVMYLNTAAPPFDDPVAREAITRAIDREAYSEVLTGGRFPPAPGPFRENSPWFRDVQFPGYDPALASELVAQYEAEHGEPLSFVYNATSSPASAARAAFLQQQFDAFGIQMTIETGEPTIQLVETLQGDFHGGSSDIFWGTQHPDIGSVFIRGENAKPVGEMGIAFTRISNPSIDAALEAARATDDPEEEADQWQIIQEEMASDLNWVFLAHADVGDVASTAVRDVVDWEFPDGTAGKTQSQNVLSVYQMWIEE